MTDIDISILTNDPFYKEMDSGKILWGDLMADEYVATTVAEEPENEYWIEKFDYFEDWTVPDLKLRKNIWENFPVSLVPLNDADGTDRYAVVWHERNLREWNDTKCYSKDEFDNYAEFCEARLMRSLKMYSHKYRVEPARTDRQICVLAMVHDTVTAPVAAPAPAPVAAPVAVAVQAKAMNVLKEFAVSWDRDGKIHYIKPHMKKLATLGKKPEDIARELYDELSFCCDCTVSPATRSGDLCTVTML